MMLWFYDLRAPLSETDAEDWSSIRGKHGQPTALPAAHAGPLRLSPSCNPARATGWEISALLLLWQALTNSLEEQKVHSSVKFRQKIRFQAASLIVFLSSLLSPTSNRRQAAEQGGFTRGRGGLQHPGPGVLSRPFPLPSPAAAGTANGHFLTVAVGFYCFCWASIGLRRSGWAP